MAPIPEPEVPSHFDSDDEESLLLLTNLQSKCYSAFHDDGTYDEAQGESFRTGTTEVIRTDISFLRRLWLVYYSALERWPLMVKSVTAFFLMMLADLLAQTVELVRGIPRESCVDLPRMLRFGVFGLLGAPWTHYYYDWLDRTMPPTEKPWTCTTAGKYRKEKGSIDTSRLESGQMGTFSGSLNATIYALHDTERNAHNLWSHAIFGLRCFSFLQPKLQSIRGSRHRSSWD